jgi:NAD(P)H-hydrate epimerase
LNAIFETRLLEVMTVPLPDEDGSLEVAGVEQVVARAERADAFVLGPGLGRAPSALEFARTAAREVKLPMLLDADGLNAHAGALESLAGREAPTVLTPHAGELARLLETDSASVGERRLDSVRRVAAEAHAIVVLKGDDTLVATPDGLVAVSRGGASALATAGTGDVLSGVIGAFLAKRMDPFEATCAGVLVHARAGQLTAREIGPEGVIASDVIAALPRARASLGS